MRRLFSWLKKPEWIFAIIALIAGGFLCFLIPNQSGFDENRHLARIWEMSGGYLIPNQRLSKGPYFPAAFASISYRNQFFYDVVDPNYFIIHAKDRIDWNVFLNYTTRSVYSPVLYLPQAVAVGLLGRLGNAPVLIIYYTCRALYLLGYILMSFFAIRLIPFGKWLLAVLALAPMAMYQSATISPDAFTNGVCFLFLAWVLKLGLQEKRVNWRQLWITIGIIALLLSVKVNAVFLLPLLLFLVWKGFESKKMLPVLAGAVVLLFAGLAVGWNVLAYSKYDLNAPGVGAMGQVAYVASHPLGFAAAFFHDLFSHGITYLTEWVAVYGYGLAQVPPVTYFLFGLALVSIWLFSPPEQPLSAKTRITLILTGIGGYLLTILILYLTFTNIGSPSIDGVQGRYLIPVMPVLLLGLLPARKILSGKAARIALGLAGAGTILALVVYTLEIYLSFYVICGASLFTPGMCYQPRYKNWDPNAYFTQSVTKGVTLQQPFTAVCTPLRSVRVWSAPATQSSAGETRIVLKNAADGTVLIDTLVGNQTAANHSWLEVPFPPINNVEGKQFILELSSALTDPAAGLSFGVTSRREYINGLLINAVPANYDLIFQYGCEP